MAFCNQCGAPMDEGRFCPMCGADNPPTEVEQPIAVAPTEYPVEEPAVAPVIPSITTVASPGSVPATAKSKKGLWIGVACIGAVVLIGVGLLLYFLVFANNGGRGEGQEKKCYRCATDTICYSLTGGTNEWWLCGSCFDMTKNDLRARYDMLNTSGEGVWETCTRCGIYSQCKLYDSGNKMELLCRFCE